jgi:hypothetical protein
VQYKADLNPGSASQWVTLTNYMPAAAGTNATYFVHAGIVQNANCGGLNAPSASPAASTGAGSLSAEPTVVPGDRSLPPVPLGLYPPGFDFSDYLILDPAHGDWISGSSAAGQSLVASVINSPAPAGDLGGPTPETGFYRVVRDGIHFVGLTNGVVLSGYVQIPVEFGVDSTDQIAGLTFDADGGPLIGAAGTGGAPWMMDWNSTLVTNGAYNVGAELDFDSDTPVTNSPVSVTVNNPIFFPLYFTRIFGNQMWILAQSAIAPANYQIDMYTGDNVDQADYIGSFSNYTADGVISFLWDLTDGNGYSYTNDSFTGVFSVAPAGTAPTGGQPLGASSSITNHWGKEAYWSGLGYFVVAYSPVDNSVNDATYENQMLIGGPSGQYGGVITPLTDKAGGPYHLSPGNVYATSAFRMHDTNTEETLLGYIADSDYRNFYFFGHGSPTGIGGGTIDPTTGGQVPAILSSNLTYALQNEVIGLHAANRHPYRLVFLDGCETASKGNWAECFGIPAQKLDDYFFVNGTGVRSRAFVGYTKPVSFNPATWNLRSAMLGNFFGDWVGRYTISQCVSNEVNDVYKTGSPMPSSATIYGAQDLNINTP